MQPEVRYKANWRSNPYIPNGRNLRSVWNLPTQPMAMELCLNCGFVWDSIQGFPRRTVQLEDGGEKTETQCRRCGAWDRWLGHFATFPEALAQTCIAAGTSEQGCCARCGAPWERILVTVGWQPTTRRCACNDRVPAIVFDPFAGSGTVGEVAYKMGRRFVCADISGNYLKLMRHRIPPMALLVS